MQLNIIDIIKHLMQSTDFPLLTAFVLGIIVAVNPCQLAISISALSYEYKNNKTLKDGIIYALGRSVTYIVLGWVTMCLIGGGKNVSGLQNALAKAEFFLPYIIAAIGIYLIFRAFRHHHHHGDDCHNSGRLIKRNGPLGSLLLGMTLAMAFCPESAIFYFGIMIPLSMTSSIGIAVPVVFGLASSIPVAVMAWIMSKTYDKAKNIAHRFEHFQQWMNGVTGVLFIAIAILLLFADN